MKITTLRNTAIIAGTGLFLFTSCFNNSADSEAAQKMLEEKEKMVEENATSSFHSDSLECTITLPKGMEETSSLDVGVPFQYKDEMKVRFIVANRELIEDVELAFLMGGFGDDKKSMRENYLDYTKKLISDTGADLTNVSETEEIMADGEKGVMMQADASNTDAILPLTYWIACFEHDGQVYKFIYWTMKSRKEKEREKVIKAFKSLKFD